MAALIAVTGYPGVWNDSLLIGTDVSENLAFSMFKAVFFEYSGNAEAGFSSTSVTYHQSVRRHIPET